MRDMEHKRAYDREWARRNQARRTAQAKARRHVDPARSAELSRSKRAANPDRYRAHTEAWRRANLDVYAAKQRRRVALKRGGFVEHVEPLVVLERGICGGDVDPMDFHVDHVLALAAGGDHAYFNVQAAHPACNLRKGVN